MTTTCIVVNYEIENKNCDEKQYFAAKFNVHYSISVQMFLLYFYIHTSAYQ